jgi:hypothetical protein
MPSLLVGSLTGDGAFDSRLFFDSFFLSPLALRNGVSAFSVFDSALEVTIKKHRKLEFKNL